MEDLLFGVETDEEAQPKISFICSTFLLGDPQVLISLLGDVVQSASHDCDGLISAPKGGDLGQVPQPFQLPSDTFFLHI